MDPISTAGQTPRDAGAPIRFAGATLGEHRHICAFFNSADEEYRVPLPFIKEGFERGDKAYHVVNSKLRAEHVRHLESAGIALPEPKQGGQFELYDWEDVYFREGRSLIHPSAHFR